MRLGELSSAQHALFIYQIAVSNFFFDIPP